MATATLAPAATVTATPTAEGITADTLAAAVAAYSEVATVGDTASATLARVAIARYTFHAARYAVTRDGVTVLPENHKRSVAALVWLDATGDVVPPASRDRSAGETSLGQYLSRFATVATDMAHGLSALTTPESAKAAYAAISDAKRDAKAREESAEAALAEIADREAFQAYLSALDSKTREAFKLVTHALTKGDAAPHAPAFIRTLSN